MLDIALTMIVKNEAAVLGRALSSAHGLYDELIVVDTGSDDGTVTIARDFGARVLDYDWRPPGHKGAARNMGLDAATADWIVVLDADELITRPDLLRPWLRSTQEIDGVHVQFMNFDDHGKVSLVWNQLRIFRRGKYRYKHREHEIPIASIAEPKETIIDVAFEHRPPADRVHKAEPMLERLLADIDQWPDDPHSIYFLHRQYAILGQHEKAIQWGMRYLAMPGDNDACECFGNMAASYRALGQLDRAIVGYHEAAARQPKRRIWWLRLAQIYYDLHEFNVALALLRLAAELWPTPEQHYQPELNEAYIYELMRRCQIAAATGEHNHG